MDVRVLGRIEIMDPADAGGRRLTGDDLPRRARQVLGVLAARHDKVQSKDALADAVWGEELPGNHAAALEHYVSVLRRVLQPGVPTSRSFIVTRAGGYVFATDRARLDLADLRAAARIADAEPGRADVREQIVRLARDLPFAEDEYADWAAPARTEVRAVLVGALLDLADGAAGDPGRAQRLAREAIELEPYAERAYRIAMRAGAGQGRADEVIRWYDQCRQSLADGLGIAPSSETAGLRESLLAGLAGAAGGPPAFERRRGDRRKAANVTNATTGTTSATDTGAQAAHITNATTGTTSATDTGAQAAHITNATTRATSATDASTEGAGVTNATARATSAADAGAQGVDVTNAATGAASAGDAGARGADDGVDRDDDAPRTHLAVVRALPALEPGAGATARAASGFVGRHAELEALAEGPDVVHVVGPAGAGKSALLGRLRERHPERVGLGRGPGPGGALRLGWLRTVLHQLGAPADAVLDAAMSERRHLRPSELDEIVQALRYRGKHPSIVAIDDAEHLDADSVAELRWLQERGVRVVVSYRYPSGIAGRPLGALDADLVLRLAPLTDADLGPDLLAASGGVPALVAAARDLTPELGAQVAMHLARQRTRWMPPAAWEILRLTAALGSLRVEQLAAAGGLELDDVLGAVDQLVHAHLLVEGPGGHVRHRSELVRGAVAAQVSAARSHHLRAKLA
ncbi:AAA family ATPase [Dactylosporangium sp. CA-139066]|uniref:AAA family ATPase n=1 Tax=Dactylosporangium sp. CA-139066 TaxID=3239930 RepID=UPI003D90B025